MRRARRAGGVVHVDRPERRAGRSRSPSSTACPATRPSSTPTCGADEIITAVDLPAGGLRRALHLPEAPRPRLLRLRAGLGRRRRWRWTATGSRRRGIALGGVAHKPWRDPRGRGAPASAARRPRGQLRARRPTRCSQDARGFEHNAFKIELARRAIVRALRADAAEPRETIHDMSTAHIGQPINRVDGRAKVTGSAKYAAEYRRAGPRPRRASSPAPSPAGRSPRSTPPRRWRVAGRDRRSSRTRTGRALAWFDRNYQRRDRAARLAVPPAPRRPRSTTAASRSRWSSPRPSSWRATRRRSCGSSTSAEPHATDLQASRRRPTRRQEQGGLSSRRRSRAATPTRRSRRRGHGRRASTASPVEHHNPMEPLRDDGRSGTATASSPSTTRPRACRTSAIPLQASSACSRSDVRVVSPFVGGGFGSGLRPQYQVFLAVLAARELKRSVRVALTRQQMFTFGHRPATRSSASRSAPRRDGTLQAHRPRGGRRDLAVRGLPENVVNWSGLLYHCDNVELDYKLAQLDLYTPLRHARAGAPLGRVRARDRAMDELAYAARHRPARAAAAELRRAGPERGQAVHQQGAARLLPRRAPSGSAGRGATRRRARCARAAS